MIVENEIAVIGEKQVPRANPADVQKDQHTYIELRAKGFTDKYIIRYMDKLGFVKKRTRNTLENWRKDLREKIRVAIKEESLDLAIEFHVGHLTRLTGLAWFTNCLMEEAKKRFEEGTENAFAAMSMKDLIKEYRNTINIIAISMRPYETDVEVAAEQNVYMNFFNKISIPTEEVEEVVDGEWTTVEESK